MQATKLATLAALVLNVAAQTPPGSKPSTNTNLMVSFNGTAVQSPGMLLPQSDTVSAPSIGFSAAGKGKYVVIMVDIDVVINGTNTNLLHWIQGDFTASAGSPQLSSPGTIIAPYVAPNPPAGQTHRYVEMLFNEPQGFSVPADFTAIFANLTASVFNRVGFNLDTFIQETKLGNPVAGNYFRVATPNDTSSSAAPSGTISVAPTGTAVASGSRTTGAAGTTGTTAPIPANDGVAGHVLSVYTLVALGMVGIAINMF